MNVSYGTPSMWLDPRAERQPEHEDEQQRARIGATTVCVHSFSTRCGLARAEREQAAVAGDERAHDAIALT